MQRIRRFFKRLFCQHVFIWERNWGNHLLHMTGGVRSTWNCKFCGKSRHENFTAGPDGEYKGNCIA